MASEPNKVTEIVSRDMAEAADRINRLWEKSERLKSDWIQSVIDVGQACIEAKAKLKYGEWGRLFDKGHMQFSRQMANNYIRVAELINALPDVKHALQLPADVTSVALLATLEPKQLMDAISKGLMTPQSTRSEVKEVIKEIKTPPTQQEIQAAAAPEIAKVQKQLEAKQAELNRVDKEKADAEKRLAEADQKVRVATEEQDRLWKERETAIRNEDMGRITELTQQLEKAESKRLETEEDRNEWWTTATSKQKTIDNLHNTIEEKNNKIKELERDKEKMRHTGMDVDVIKGIEEMAQKIMKKYEGGNSDLRYLHTYIRRLGQSIHTVKSSLIKRNFVSELVITNRTIVAILTDENLGIRDTLKEDPQLVDLRNENVKLGILLEGDLDE